MGDRAEAVREAHASFRADPQRAWDRCADDVVLHIAGDHPLSGDYAGLDAVRGYVATVVGATQGRGGYSVTSAFADDSGDLLLVEGTAFHGEEPFVRTVVYLLRFEGDRVVELWENPFDQRAEDRFWSSRLPWRRGRRLEPVRIPRQPSLPLGTAR